MSDITGSAEADNGARGPVGFFTGNPIAGKLLMLLLLAGGAYTATRLEVSMLPDMELHQIVVSVDYPGASPAEVSEDINRRIEENLISLEGVGRVTSYAGVGHGRVVVTLDVFADRKDALDTVQSAVDGIRQFPPLNAEAPEVAAMELPREVMTVAVASTGLSEMQLREAAERVQEDLLALPNVTQVTPHALRDREIQIEASEETLRRHDMTIDGLAARVREASLNLSAGELRTDAGELVLRTHSKRTRAEEFENIVVLSNADGSILRLRDLARVDEGFADTPVSTRIDNQSAVLLGIYRSKGQNALYMAEEVRRMLAGYTAPRGADVFVWNDKTEYVWSRVNTLLAAGFMGFALVLILLALALDFRVALWVAVGVPTSFLGALLLFPAFDIGISLATVFVLVMLIGIVVDDAVVVGESIASQHERGVRGAAAARAGTRDVLVPVTLGCITTGLAFTPLLFVDGVEGQFLRLAPIVVGLVLVVSLTEAFLILPSHLARSEPWSRWPMADLKARAGETLERWRDFVIVPAITAAVRRPFVTLLAGIAVVAVSAGLLATGVVRSDPPGGLSFSQIRVDLEFQPGTPFEVTEAAAERVADAARQANDQAGDDPFKTVAVVVGQQLGMDHLFGATDAKNGGHLATVVAHLDTESQRSLSSQDLERLWLAHVGDVPGAVAVRASRGTSPAQWAYALSHPDPHQLASIVAGLRQVVEAQPGVDYVEDSLTPGKLQYDVELTEAGEAAGLSARMVASQLRSRFHGIDAQRIQRGREEIKVMVRYPAEDRRSLRELWDERIAEIPLHTAARISESREPSTIMRIDGVPAAEVAARFDVGTTSHWDIERAAAQALEESERLYPGLRAVPLGTIESEARLIESLTYTVPIILLVMYILIAIQFRSYWHPLVILAGIPFAFAGAVIGHAILGYPAPASSGLGVIAVAGVAVNDTLVLMHRYNQIQAQSPMPVIAAVSAAARQRFRPIALTTATTVVGMAPLLFIKSEIMIGFMPLAVSLVFGLIAAAVGILFIVPTLLYLAETARERRRPAT